MARVLLLEDEADLVEYLPLVLREKGLEVVGTASIDEAMQKFATEDFDAVLLDIMMTPSKDMDAEKLDYGRVTGIEVARRMRAIKQEVPLVAFTVLNDLEIRAQMREAGITQIINKPSEIDQIANGIWQAIRAGKR